MVKLNTEEGWNSLPVGYYNFVCWQTGQPYINSDGTVYRYDPANPPKVVTDEDSEAGSGGCGTSSHHKNAGSS